MARAIRWQIPFKDLNNTAHTINIYQEGWTGGITQLKGGESPIETEEPTDADVFIPMRLSTGHINIIAESDLSAIFASTSKSRYVTLMRGDSLMWQGYIQPTSNDMRWDAYPMELSIPIQSCLAVLKGEEISADSFGLASIATYIREAITASGMNCELINFPAEWNVSSATATTSSIINAQVLRSAFIDDSNIAEDSPAFRQFVPNNHYDVLEKILTFLGWTIVEVGTSIYLLSTKATRYAVASLSSFGSSTYTTIPIFSYSLPQARGTNHNQSTVPPKHIVSVKTKSKDMTNVIGAVDVSDSDIDKNGRFNMTIQGGWTAIGFDNKSRQLKANVIFYEYQIDYYIDSSGNLQVQYINDDYRHRPFSEFFSGKDADPSGTTPSQLTHYGARAVKWDVFNDGDDNKKSLNYKDSIAVVLSAAHTAGNTPQYKYPSLQQMKDHPILRITSQRPILIKNGIICINFGYDENVGSLNTLMVRMKVGNQYWHRSGGTDTWSTSEAWVSVDAAHDDKTRYDVYPEYNDARGYIIRVPAMLSGNVQIDVAIDPTNRNDFLCCGLQQFNVSIMLPDVDYGKQRREGDTYYANTGVDGENVDVSVDLLTMNKGLPAYNCMYLDNDYLTDQLYFYGTRMRPEVALANRIKDWCSKSRSLLNVTTAYPNFSKISEISIDSSKYTEIARRTFWRDAKTTLTLIEK